MPRGRHRVFREEREALLSLDSDQSNNWVQLRNRGHQQDSPTVGFVQQHQQGGSGGSQIKNNNISNNNNNPFASRLARFDFISHEVQPGETLAGIALRYNCKLPHLKQANNLSSEAHLAALPYVKVPVPRNGVQTGQLIDISTKVEIRREGPPREELCPQRFMENLDEKLKELHKSAPPPVTPPPITELPVKPRTYFNSTCLLVTCLVGVCIGLPIFYTMYILANGDMFRVMGAIR
ncbi:lysM and putative peptidoglycan-binding domain-containing protein 4-like [Galendromus occidentalis]|uniref:LysM and putative peptidoglycan-binding domain-containing protein 4-like n=1 Tax=Galendromus occidentalis TaxID=34638 RepID=A0AAJ6W031_9ACAR|nr:lysM and putative peptidoglycan-binding domain-containing protein 4-like [Galendromus occidentalis]